MYHLLSHRDAQNAWATLFLISVYFILALINASLFCQFSLFYLLYTSSQHWMSTDICPAWAYMGMCSKREELEQASVRKKTFELYGIAIWIIKM